MPAPASTLHGAVQVFQEPGKRKAVVRDVPARVIPDVYGEDPEVGLEAGVIAMLGGNESAARKSWQSVLDAAPDSVAAGTARGYLAQLDAEEAPAP